MLVSLHDVLVYTVFIRFRTAVAHSGSTTVVAPYTDMLEGSTVMSIAKTLGKHGYDYL